MRGWPVALLAALALAGTAYGEDSEPESRARKQCKRVAEARGLKVEKVGNAEKVGKKRYEVSLRVKRKKADDTHVICRYDDKIRQAEISP
jgi:phenylalanyl-tRNA synthetase alpha subunit